MAALKDELKRRSRHDTENKGWLRAFALKPKRFAFSRPTAEMFIVIHEYFQDVTIGNTVNLPISWRTLYETTVVFKNRRSYFLKLVEERKITPLTTRDEIAIEYGTPKARKDPDRNQKMA